VLIISIVGSIVAGTFLILAAWIGREHPAPPIIIPGPTPAITNPPIAPKVNLEFVSTEVITQSVNQKFIDHGRSVEPLGSKLEKATVKLRVKNSGDLPAKISKAEFIVDDVEVPQRRVVDGTLGSTLAHHPPIDHAGHISVRMDPMVIGEAIPIAVEQMPTIFAGAHRDLVFWFHVPYEEKNLILLMLTKGRVRLYVGDQGFISNSIDLEIHSENQPWDFNGGLLR